MSNKVLIIDNAISDPTSSLLLSKEGYTVDVVPNSDMGLQQLQSKTPDVIIVQERPEAESWHLCEKIRRMSPRPLIVISGNVGKETYVKTINAGADYFMRRPFGHLEFLARVRSLLRRASPN